MVPPPPRVPNDYVFGKWYMAEWRQIDERQHRNKEGWAIWRLDNLDASLFHVDTKDAAEKMVKCFDEWYDRQCSAI